MDGDIEEIEQFLNQIELLVQSRSPLGRKTADELFKRLNRAAQSVDPYLISDLPHAIQLIVRKVR